MCWYDACSHRSQEGQVTFALLPPQHSLPFLNTLRRPEAWHTYRSLIFSITHWLTHQTPIMYQIQYYLQGMQRWLIMELISTCSQATENAENAKCITNRFQYGRGYIEVGAHFRQHRSWLTNTSRLQENVQEYRQACTKSGQNLKTFPVYFFWLEAERGNFLPWNRCTNGSTAIPSWTRLISDVQMEHQKPTHAWLFEVTVSPGKQFPHIPCSFIFTCI